MVGRRIVYGVSLLGTVMVSCGEKQKQPKQPKAIRMGKRKGLILNIRREGESNMLLFDLDADPQEQNNVAAAHPDIIQTMREKMAEAHEEPVIKSYAM